MSDHARAVYCPGCGGRVVVSSDGKLIHLGNGSSYCDPDATLDGDEETE
jgi:hypothetical protein